MGISGTETDAETLKRFLERPHSRARFDAFFGLCYRHVLGYLGCLKTRGYQMPLEPKADRNPLADLAIDILGSLLQSTKEQPFTIIFDHYHRIGIVDFRQADPVILYDHFRSLLGGFVRQELSRLRKEADPQLDHLKRRFKDTLKPSDYTAFRSDGDPTEYVCLTQHNHDSRENYALISREELAVLVEDAFHRSRNRKQWCRAIFESLNDTTTVRNCIRKHELLAAVIAVNMKYVDVDGPGASRLPGANQGIVETAICEANKQTIVWLRDSVLQGFIEKERMTTEVAERFASAAERYLLDLAHSGDTDALPVYFREVMPETEHDRYLKEYKYLFETTISKAEEDFKKRLKKSLQ